MSMDRLRTLYRLHGTKLLGSAAALVATVSGVLATLTALPQTQVLLTPKQFAIMAMVNAALGVLTIKRGFSNSMSASNETQPGPH